MLKLIIIIGIAVFMSACSTINRGTTDHFRIDTVPQGAKVTTSLLTRKAQERFEKQKNSRKATTFKPEYIGCEPTPCAIELPRLSEFVATLEHSGYEPAEIFIRSSNLRSGSTANAAANIASASGTGFAVAGSLAVTELLFVEIANILTFNTFPQTVNTSGFASSGAAIGLGAGVGMMAIDAGMGANRNLFPNPVVIELAEQGTPTRTDPLVDLYWEKTEAESHSITDCRLNKYDKVANKDACKEAKADFRRKKTAFNTLKRKQMDRLRATIKAEKEKQKANQIP